MDTRALAIALAAGFGAWALMRSQEAGASVYNPQPEVFYPPDVPDWDILPGSFADVPFPAFEVAPDYTDWQTPPYIPVPTIPTTPSPFELPAVFPGWSSIPFEEDQASLEDWENPEWWGSVPINPTDEDLPETAPPDLWPDDWGWGDVPSQAPEAPQDAPYGDIGYGESWEVLTKPAPSSALASPWGEALGPTIAAEHPNVRAFLFAIRVGEGTADPLGYRRLVGGGEFDSFADHPKALGWSGWVFTNPATGKRDISTAAGAYQIVFQGSNPARPQWPYYRGILGLPDFSPDSQDRFAINFLRESGAYNSILRGDFTDAVNRAASRWASLPGAGYGQREEKLASVAQYYRNYGGAFSPNNAVAMYTVGVRG